MSPKYRKFLEKTTPYLYLLPACIILGVFFVYAIINVWYISFHKYNVITPARFIGLDNYRNMLQDPVFWKSLSNTLIYMLGTVPLMMASGLGLAMLLNRQLRAVSWFRAAYFMPVVTSMVSVAIMWKWVYNGSFGLLNYVLRSVGLIDADIAWLANTSTALSSVMLVDIWKQAGFFMVIFLAGLQSIPVELYEAARIDGAGRWRLFRNVTIPLLNPVIVFASIDGLIASAKAFEQFYIMTQGGPVNATLTMVYYVYQNAFQYFDMGYGSAVAISLFLLILLFTLVGFRVTGRDIEY